MSFLEFSAVLSGDRVGLLVWVVTKATLVLMVAAFVAQCLQKSSAALRHSVWSLGLIGALLLPAFCLIVPQLRVPVLAGTTMPLKQFSQSPRSNVGVGWQESHRAVMSADTQQLPSLELDPTTFNPMHVDTPKQAPQGSAGKQHLSVVFQDCLLVVWSVGLLAVTLPIASAFRRNRALLTHCSRITDPPSIALVQELSRLVGLKRCVKVFESSEPVVPMTWGVVHPVILLPNTWREWQDRQRRCVLLHELAHVKRFDVILQLTARIAAGAYWFNPLVWYGLRQLRIERELACDDCVIRAGERASEYARELLTTMRRCRPRQAAVGLAMASSARLDRRVQRILDVTTCRLPIGKRTAGAFMLIAFTLVVATAAVHPVLRSGIAGQIEPTASKDNERNATESNGDASQVLREIVEEFREAQQVWAQKYREATTDEARAQLEEANVLRIFEQRFLELARTHAEQPVAMDAVQWLAENANPGPVFDEGLRLIEQHHLEDNGIAKLCRTLVVTRTPGAEHFLQTVTRKHQDREIQGIACLSLARYLNNFRGFAMELDRNQQWLEKVKPHFGDDIVAWFRAADPATLSTRVEILCEKVIGEYGDVSDSEYIEATGQVRNLGDAAKALSFSLNPIGKTAPRTVGKGVDGSPVSLTDFRGKVTLLMFSANWCVPCKEMYGQLRELMSLHADKPFTVTTIMADEDISTVRKAVNSGEVTWPVIWDGDNGPIARGWNVTAYPTIYLIDHDGHIRQQGLRDDPLDDEVARMLGVAPESRARVDKRTRTWRLSFRDMHISGEELPELLEGYTELRELDLSYNPLSDDALAHLQPLKKLQILHLEHTGISDKGLQHLVNLPSLKELVHYRGPGHRTTPDGRRKLREAIPGLKMPFTTH